jgi:hypothetical protein
MPKTCDFKDPIVKRNCGVGAMWIADVGWTIPGPDESSAPGYTGTSWSMALCEKHYEELRNAGRITGTPHRVRDSSQGA